MGIGLAAARLIAAGGGSVCLVARRDAPTKFALVGLAEALRSELRPYGIRISVLYSPDTATAGLEEENRTKPAECRMMSDGAEQMDPRTTLVGPATLPVG